MNEKANTRWVIALTSASALLAGLDATVVSTALTKIRSGLNASSEQLEWTVNAYTLSLAVLILTAAALGDRFGRRRIFTIGLGLFAVASAGCALAPNPGWLIAARAVQGAGAAAVMPLALALLGSVVAPGARARALGAFTAVVGASVPAGPLLGGAVVDGASWRWIFWLNVPVIAVLIPLAVRYIPESRGAGSHVDVAGLLLGTGAAFGLVFGLVYTNVASLAVGALMAAVFVVVQRRNPQAMLPMRLFGSRGFAAGNAVIFLLWASTFGSLYYMAQFLQVSLGSRPLLAGAQLVPWGAMTILVPRLAGAFIPRFGERLFIVAGMALHGTGMIWIAAIASPTTPYWQLIAPLVVSGAGVAAAIPATQSAVLGSVPSADIGKASGAYNMLRQLGGAFGVAVLVSAFGTPRDFAVGFAAALTVSAALAGAGLLAGIAVPARHAAAIAPAKP